MCQTFDSGPGNKRCAYGERRKCRRRCHEPTGVPISKLAGPGRERRTPQSRGSQFPPIEDYGFISDCEVSALIAPSGNVEWMCLPRMDGPAIFAAMLDRDAGRFRLGPTDVVVPAGRRYLPGTMVLETTWDTPTGWAVVRDVLLIGPWRHTLQPVGDSSTGADRL